MTISIKVKKEQVRKPILTHNRKVAANVQAMFEKWEQEQFPSRVQKQEADPKSIGSRKQEAAKLGIRLTRSAVRTLLKEKQLVAPKGT